VIAALLISIALVGCGAGANRNASLTPSAVAGGSAPVPSATPSPTPVLPGVARSPADAGRLAQEDLAERLGLDVSQIDTLEVTRTELTPQQLGLEGDKGGTAPPAELLGYEVKLRVGDTEYVYYVRGTQVILKVSE